jgi:transcription elongation factor GreA
VIDESATTPTEPPARFVAMPPRKSPAPYVSAAPMARTKTRPSFLADRPVWPGYSRVVDEVHLSREARDRLAQEHEWRSGERRSEISQWIERAREHGDIRENADYDAAKNEQGHNEARIRHLEALLRSAVVVETAAADVVQPGTLVEIRMDDEEDTNVYLVGSIEERHATYDVLSPSSPLGTVLMGRTPGEIVDFAGPKRAFQVEIVSVAPRAD